MAYIKNNWVDREGTTRYFETVDDDGALIFTPDYTQVTELGTPVNADNMNHIEEGIAAGSFTKFDLNATYAKDDLVTVIEEASPVIYKSLVDNNIGNALSDSAYWGKISINAGRIEEKISNLITVVETYQNGYSGYRIWSDKYCEQWGLFDYGSLTQDNNGKQITLIKPFANSNYIISGNAFRNDKSAGVNGLCAVPIGFFAQTTNYFYIRWFADHNETTRFAFWKACGYIA